MKAGYSSFSDITPETWTKLQATFNTFLFDIFGLKDDTQADNNGALDGLMELVLDMRASARSNKDWGTSDKIRDTLKALKIQVKDGKEGTEWSIE